MKVLLKIMTGVATVIASGFVLSALSNPRFVGSKVAGIFQKSKVGFSA